MALRNNSMRKLLKYRLSGKCLKDGADGKLHASQHHGLQEKDKRRPGRSNLGPGKETLPAYSQQV